MTGKGKYYTRVEYHNVGILYYVDIPRPECMITFDCIVTTCDYTYLHSLPTQSNVGRGGLDGIATTGNAYTIAMATIGYHINREIHTNIVYPVEEGQDFSLNLECLTTRSLLT